MGTLGLRVVGGYFSLLTLLSWPGQAYLAFTYIRKTWQEWERERKVGAYAVDALLLSCMPLIGYAASVTLYYGAVKARRFYSGRATNRAKN